MKCGGTYELVFRNALQQGDSSNLQSSRMDNNILGNLVWDST